MINTGYLYSKCSCDATPTVLNTLFLIFQQGIYHQLLILTSHSFEKTGKQAQLPLRNRSYTLRDVVSLRSNLFRLLKISYCLGCVSRFASIQNY